MDKVLKAAAFAAIKHKDQKSHEDDDIPFINHPIGMADTLANVGKETDPVLLQAALLHDTVEWTETTLEEIEQEFGQEVANLVKEVTPQAKGGILRKDTVNSLSEKARKLMLADWLWYLKTLDERPEELQPHEKRRFAEGAQEVNIYKGVSTAIEAELDKVLSKHNLK